VEHALFSQRNAQNTLETQAVEIIRKETEVGLGERGKLLSPWFVELSSGGWTSVSCRVTLKLGHFCIERVATMLFKLFTQHAEVNRCNICPSFTIGCLRLNIT
jgi:hypothetical protein